MLISMTKIARPRSLTSKNKDVRRKSEVFYYPFCRLNLLKGGLKGLFCSGVRLRRRHARERIGEEEGPLCFSFNLASSKSCNSISRRGYTQVQVSGSVAFPIVRLSHFSSCLAPHLSSSQERAQDRSVQWPGGRLLEAEVE